jgi:hypothetical protein
MLKERNYEEKNAITLNSARGAGKVTAKIENAKVFGYNAAIQEIREKIT